MAARNRLSVSVTGRGHKPHPTCLPMDASCCPRLSKPRSLDRTGPGWIELPLCEALGGSVVGLHPPPPFAQSSIESPRRTADLSTQPRPIHPSNGTQASPAKREEHATALIQTQTHRILLRMSSSSLVEPPLAARRPGGRRPLVYTVEAPEGGATVLHRLAPAGGRGGDAARTWTGAYTMAVAVAVAAAVAASLAAPPARPLVAAATIGALLLLRSLIQSRTVVAESILVIAGLGIQLQTHFASGREAVRFVDLGRVRAVLINEGITMHRVIFYLALVVEGQERLVVAFPHLEPRLEELLPVYESLRPVVAAAQAGKGEAESTGPGGGLGD